MKTHVINQLGTLIKPQQGKRAAVLLLSVVLWNAPLVFADGAAEPQYDVIQLSAQSQSEVANDLMRVNLVAQSTGPDAAELGDKINAMMGWAVSKLKPFTAIKTETRD